MTNVLFLWKADIRLRKYFQNSFYKRKNIKLVFPRSFSEKNLLRLSEDANIIIGWRPSLNLLQSAAKLKLFINPGTGIKHHINNFREINKLRKVILVNGHGHAYATAQHAVAMLLAITNKVVTHHNRMSAGIWRTSDDKDVISSSVSLRKRKIGLLGYGAINKFVHKFLSGFENEFHVLKRDLKNAQQLKNKKLFKYSIKDLHRFLKEVDVLIIAIPHTSETENLIGTKELKLLGKTGLLVNVARGIIVNEKSLYEALSKNVIEGAALDVWYNYSPEKDKQGREFPFKYPFHKLKNILMSPHRAASPFDDLKRWDEVIENINRFADGRKDFLNVVDLEKEY